ncbi:MAG: hypothetical protein COY40_03870 [Alphaproteobacteria bacterium CG_4_10_14_0_8_um_filter_53_9]|nr:MAG: hypothetical protein COY40_03870 [Alphaproteobacteria bacterium CG_4_10_14_0_8_um_filter_53_9]
MVYKIDRLTRSLADFAKMMELFDSHKVTGERIRNKIAASKTKGMWMGGTVPLGYNLADRKLTINPQEADLIRHIFQLYLDLGSIQQVQETLTREGHSTKQRGTRPGRPFTQGNLANILTNPLYIGKVTHKGRVHEGLHEAIVPDDLWQTTANGLEQTWQTTSPATRNLIVRSVVHRITATHGELQVQLSKPSLLALLKGEPPSGQPDPTNLIKETIPAQLTSLGKQKRLIIAGQGTQTGEPNPELIKAVALGHHWRQLMLSGKYPTQQALADHLQLAKSHVNRYIQLGLLAPDIVEAILTGHQPLGLAVADLYKVSTADWPAQRRQLGFAA